jgi:hypothetical protein
MCSLTWVERADIRGIIFQYLQPSGLGFCAVHAYAHSFFPQFILDYLPALQLLCPWALRDATR